jgi:nucleotide-binding universal stress UspA family protein
VLEANRCKNCRLRGGGTNKGVALALQCEGAMRLQKILCPIDFSEGAKAALRTAIRIANEASAELVIAHVCYLPPAASFTPALTQEIEKEAQQFLDDATLEAKSLGAARVSSKLLTGTPWSAIVELLDHDLTIGLVVVGTR